MKNIKTAMLLLFLAGLTLGFGIGAKMQYDTIENFLIEIASEEEPVQIGDAVYTLTPYNTSNLTLIDLPFKGGTYVRN